MAFWDGETDAQHAVSQATFYNGLTNLAANVVADVGCKLIPCKLQNCSNASASAGEPAINAAIVQSWSDANTLTGPDLNGIDTSPEDDLHLLTDAKVQQATTLWYNAVVTAFGF